MIHLLLRNYTEKERLSNRWYIHQDFITHFSKLSLLQNNFDDYIVILNKL